MLPLASAGVHIRIRRTNVTCTDRGRLGCTFSFGGMSHVTWSGGIRPAPAQPCRRQGSFDFGSVKWFSQYIVGSVEFPTLSVRANLFGRISRGRGTRVVFSLRGVVQRGSLRNSRSARAFIVLRISSSSRFFARSRYSTTAASAMNNAATMIHAVVTCRPAQEMGQLIFSASCRCATICARDSSHR